MRVLIAFDKFKNALSARAACQVAFEALRVKHPDWEFDVCPLADGGEGFAETLVGACGGEFVETFVKDPRSKPIAARYGLVECGKLSMPAAERLAKLSGKFFEKERIAVLEMSAASGLELLTAEERDPWQTTTVGTGELLSAAAQRGVAAILLGVGGSATNDLGVGALEGVGFRFLDRDDKLVSPPCPTNWESISRMSGKIELPPIFIACDVTNPLLGPDGCTNVYGRQKGLSDDDVPRLEQRANRMASLLCASCNQPISMATAPGAGAAGGLAFGLMVALNAKLLPGFDLVADWLNIRERAASADIILTGEGKFDATSLTGKGPGGIVALAHKLNKQVHVFAGSLGVPAAPCLHAISPPGLPLKEALRKTPELLQCAILKAL
jgi:glycerate kinase